MNIYLLELLFLKDPIDNKLKGFPVLSLVDDYQHLIKCHENFNKYNDIKKYTKTKCTKSKTEELCNITHEHLQSRQVKKRHK
jgi:hypothetical protein